MTKTPIGLLLLVFLSSCSAAKQAQDVDVVAGDGTVQLKPPDIHEEVTEVRRADLPGEVELVAAPDATPPEVEPPDVPAIPDVPDVPAATEVEDVPKPPDIPPPNLDLTPLCSPGGDGKYNVYDLQSPDCGDHPNPEPQGPPGLAVELADVVVTGVFPKVFFVQEKKGGPWSGIAIYSGTKSTAGLKAGNVITVTGAFQEFYGVSEVYMDQYTVTGSAMIPPPVEIAWPDWLATGGGLAEPFEGVLVRVDQVVVVDTKPDCPHEFGEFMVSGKLRVDDLGPWSYEPSLGDELGYVTGIVHYTFGNSKLEPRDNYDILVQHVSNGGATKCINTSCVEDLAAAETGALVVTEIMYNPFGADDQMEWFEVYNPGNSPVDMANWTLHDCAMLEVVLTADFAPIVPAKGFAILGPEDDTTLNGGVTVDAVYPKAQFYLPNSEGSILLYDAQKKLVDQVRYASFGGWPEAAGASIELADPKSDNTMPSSWNVATEKFGPTDNLGSPGKL